MADETAFHAWLASSSMHADAFEEVDHTWDIIGSLPINLRTRQPKFSPRPLGRRAVVAGLGVALTASISFSFFRSASASVYQTDVGEQKHVALPDGCQLFLDTETCVSVDYTDSARSVGLKYGRVNFQVVSDSKRPFIVEAATRKIVSVNSNFDVYCEGSRVQVVLVRGKAAVTSPNTAHRSETLGPGERFVAEPEVVVRDKPNLTPLLAWQTGQAIFENTQLTEAVQQMNRYSTEKLEIGDSRVGGLRVSGAYRVGDNNAFARSVAALLPLNVRHEDDHIVFESTSD